MRCRHHRWLMTIAVTIVGVVSASSSLAVPYEWTIGQVQGLADVTPGFHGGAGQLSTINSITPVANGIQLDVTYRIGQDVDPFGPDYGLGFAQRFATRWTGISWAGPRRVYKLVVQSYDDDRHHGSVVCANGLHREWNDDRRR